MNKHIQAAIDERRHMYWEYGPLNENQSMGRYQLRAETAVHENGAVRSRRLFATMSEVAAENLHREIREAGVPEYGPTDYVPPGVPAVIGAPAQARAAARLARLMRD